MRVKIVRSSELGDDWSAEAHMNDQVPEALPGERSDDPLAYECPACFSPPRELCTAPTVAGRRPVGWVHSARKDLAEGWT